MKKRRILLLLLAVLASSSYAMTEEYEGPSHYRVFDKDEIFDPIERGAYENILRLVDEQNRAKGTLTNYFEKAQYKGRVGFDEVDLVPVAQFTGGSDKYVTEVYSEKHSSISGYSTVHDVVNKKDQGLKEKGIFDKLKHSKKGNTKRFFFGNGNKVQDIIMTGSDSFDEKIMEARNSKKELHLLEGTYERAGKSRPRNQLDLKFSEYEELRKKTPEEQLQFIAERMSKKFSKKVEIKDGQLYTKDQHGKEWRVLWTMEPVSEAQISWGTDKKFYKDDIFTNIFLYTPTLGKEDKTDSQGRVLYTKDKSIILEDKYTYGDVAKISEILERNYLEDKKKLSEADFHKKWILPFEEGGEFSKEIEKMTKEIEEVKKNTEDMRKKYEEADNKLNSWRYSDEAPLDFRSNYIWEDDAQRKEIYIKAMLKKEKYKAFITKYLEQEKILKENDVSTIIDKDIPKKYGMYGGWGASAADRKWLDKVVPNKEIRKKYLGKHVEFRGQGRIDGVLDLGEGHNVLLIAEQFTGKYGTNITLGPKAVLKNIAFIDVSGAIGSNTKASLSGRTSLTLDIDPSVKDKKGRLIQHAFRNSDKNIVFRAMGVVLGSSNMNDFAMELMASKIPENSTIDMGRKLTYMAQDYEVADKEVLAKTNIISDSIAHTVSQKEELSEDGNTLLSVKIKEELKRFDGAENKVYASIKNSGNLMALQPTLTSTNKRTVFQVADDDRDARKKRELIRAIRTMKAKDALEEVSDFHLDETRTKEAAKKMETILNSKKMKELIKETEELKSLKSSPEYEHLKLAEKKEIISKLNPEETRAAISQNRYNKETIQEKLKEMKEVIENIDEEKLSKLATSHPGMEKLGGASHNVKYLKEELKKNPTNNRKIQGLFSTFNGLLENLKEQLLLTEEDLDYKFARHLETYNEDIRRDYLELKDMLFYSIREEEAFSELKNMVAQLKDKNIYSKLNKVAKSEISTYTNFPFDIDRSLVENRPYSRGGGISTRTVQKNLKGNIYTGYGIYEEEYKKGLRLGVMAGGANTEYKETYSRTLRTVATESTIKGVSAYAGVYANKSLTNRLDWITGLGLQYGFYSINRQMKNNYQELDSKGKVGIGGVNTYTGFVYSYPLPNDLILRGKGILSYSLLRQGKIKEKKGLNLEIDAKEYHYVDGELGLSLAKTLYDDSKRSTLSGGIAGIFGLSGYENKALKSKVKGSTSGFDIAGDKTKKDSIKVHLDYNMQLDTGFNYGLEGTYITNKEQSDVKIGLKAGYRF